LGKVINSLSEPIDRKTRYIPYRDSKLTFLLKDSIGGNSKCTLIANINPNSLFFNECLSTLKFAQRAKMIKNDVLINEEASGNIECLKLEIRRLKEQILRQNLMESQLNCQLHVPFSNGNVPSNVPNALTNISTNGQSNVPLSVQLTNIAKVNAGIIEIEKTMKSYLEQSIECEGGLRLEIERMREELERAKEGLEKAEKNEIQMRLVLGLMQERLRRKPSDPESNHKNLKID
jgi:kinesin family protein 15